LKTTAGTVTLSGAIAGSTYTGPTTVVNGTLQAGGSFVFSQNSVTTIDAGGVLNLSGVGQIIDTIFLTGGVIERGSLTGRVTSTGGTVDGIGGTTGLAASSGVTTLNTTTGSNTYSGATTVNGGATLMGGAAFAFSDAGATTISAGGTLDLNGFDQTVRELAGAGIVTSTGGAATLTVNETASPGSNFAGAITDGPGSGNTVSLDVNGSPLAPLTLSNPGGNTYTGTTTIETSATLIGGANNAFSMNSPTTVQGTLDLGGVSLTQTINSVTLSGGTIQNGILTSSNGITSNGGVVDGIRGTTGLAANSGVTTLNTTTGSNAYTGATTVDGGATLMGGAINAFSAVSPTTVGGGGTLDLGGFGQTVTSLTGGGTVTNSGPGGATLTVNDTVSTTFAGVIQDGLPPTGGQTGLAVQGPGAFILTGASTPTPERRRLRPARSFRSAPAGQPAQSMPAACPPALSPTTARLSSIDPTLRSFTAQSAEQDRSPSRAAEP
jgi:autotransporter-associated beta strand protein